ncbi:RNA methyltransferase [Halanaerobaculum tunisiense]
MSQPDLYLALLHYPVYNKNQEVITTTVTNLDLHDIARASRTYNLNQYYIVNPLASQQEMVERMNQYWSSDFGGDYNPDRQEAFSLLQIADELPDVVADIKEQEGQKPVIISTDARTYPNTITFKDLRSKMEMDNQPYLLLLGTGWGLTEEVMTEADYILEPIAGAGDYNHLSVRSAAAIMLDRLLGSAWWEG